MRGGRDNTFIFHLIFSGESGKFSGGFDISTLSEIQKTGIKDRIIIVSECQVQNHHRRMCCMMYAWSNVCAYKHIFLYILFSQFSRFIHMQFNIFLVLISCLTHCGMTSKVHHMCVKIHTSLFEWAFNYVPVTLQEMYLFWDEFLST